MPATRCVNSTKAIGIACCLFVGTAGALAQTVEQVKSASVSAYAGKSYEFRVGVTLQPGFTVNAITHGTFYCKSMGNRSFSLDQNFVRKETILVTGATTEAIVNALPLGEKLRSFQYIDGLGRKDQDVLEQASPLTDDLVQPIDFDDVTGRQMREYIQYVKVGQFNGAFRPNATSEVVSYYTSPGVRVDADTKPYKQNTFEPSPLDRVVEATGPGEDWHNALKSVKSTLTLSQASENIIKWAYFVSGTPVKEGTWGSNQLLVEEVVNEEGQVTRKYKDLRGLEILSRVGKGSEWFDTYSIYSPSGLLMIVVQPEGVTRLATEFDAADANGKQSFLNRWCFMYQYDDEQRIIAKHVPGWEDPTTHAAAWMYMVYDQWNRLVMSQTPAQKSRNEWLFNKFDLFNRVAVSGLHTSSSDRQTLQNAVNAHYAANPAFRFEDAVNNATGYTLNKNYPVNPAEPTLIAVNYYDNYLFQNYTGWDQEGTSSDYNFVNLSGFPQSTEKMTSVKGYPTGSKLRVLGTTRWLNNIFYYDKKYRVIQSISENYVGGRDRTTTLVDFVGKPLKTQTYHTSASASLTVLREFEYDHTGRSLKIWQTTDNGTRTLLASNKYNEIGQLIEKNIHSTDNGANFLQSVDMRYNIRGWLTSINNSTLTNDGTVNDDTGDLFGMEMLYNTAQPSITGYPGSTVPKLYDGNISAIKWKTDTKQATPAEQIYGFEYDALDRLKQAHYATGTGLVWTGNSGLFNEHITSYDKNGNINGIVRKGKVEGASATIDNLTHAYALSGSVSNRLISVADASGNATGFKDGATMPEEFLYDASGNLNFDYNKQISSVTYNHLNLPQVVQFTRPGGQIDKIEYSYDAAGTKLRTVVKVGGSPVLKSDYVGDIQYDDDQIVFASTPEGRAVRNSAGYDYEYFYKDHLGNVRLTYGALKETVSYRATLENPAGSSLGADEEATFKNVSATRYQNAVGETFNYTKASTEVLVPDKSSKTNSFLGKTVGPAKSLSVASGDKVRIEVFAKYVTPPGSTATIADAALVTALATTTFGIPSGEVLYSGFNSQAPIVPGIGGGSSTLPQAYLAYLFFDNNNVFVSASAVAISTAAYDAFEKLERTFTAPQAGKLFVYVANETNVSAAAGSVYFDEMKIIHQKANNTIQVTQASDYYPFGLAFNTYQSERMSDGFAPIQKNRYGFQGQEWQKDLDLNWSQFKWRMHDPSIGRFGGIDPLSNEYVYNSTYAFSENHVTTHLELEGLEKISIHSASFAPYGVFGGVYLGDGEKRMFGTNPSASSRIYGRVDLDMSGEGIEQIGTSYSQGSWSRSIFGQSKYSDAEMDVNIDGGYADGKSSAKYLDFHLSGNLSLIEGSPDIDVYGKMSIKVEEMEDGNLATFSGWVDGDRFPANETYIRDQNGTGVFFGVSGADPGNGNQHTGPLTRLPGANKRPMSQFNFGIKFNPDGSMKHILYNGNELSIEDWNSLFQFSPQSSFSTNFR